MAESAGALLMAAAVGAICAVGDVMMLTIDAASIAAGHLTAPVAHVSIATIATGNRLAFASLSCCRCLQARLHVRNSHAV